LTFPSFYPFASVVGLSADSVEKHAAFVKDIDQISKSCLSFPIVGDEDRRIAQLYSMLDGDEVNVDEVSLLFRRRRKRSTDASTRLLPLLLLL